jgi:hypothetical protein
MAIEHEKFAIVKSICSALICEVVSELGINIPEKALNEMSNNYADKIIAHFPSSNQAAVVTHSRSCSKCVFKSGTQCRRHAPIGVMKEYCKNSPVATFPVFLDGDSWCGDFERREG